MRIVLDTNVLLPALFAPGLCAELLDLLVEAEGCVLVLSDYILDECREHATRKFRVPRADLDAALGTIAAMAELVEPAPVPRGACPDADDLPVLGTAIAGKADALITGDRDLLALRRFDRIPILSPREFFDRMR